MHICTVQVSVNQLRRADVMNQNDQLGQSTHSNTYCLGITIRQRENGVEDTRLKNSLVKRIRILFELLMACGWFVMRLHAYAQRRPLQHAGGPLQQRI